jgi:hypothetical protein
MKNNVRNDKDEGKKETFQMGAVSKSLGAI